MFIYLCCVALFFASLIAQLYFLYRYYLRNQLAHDWINFFAKNLSFNKTCTQIVFQGRNSHQPEAKRVKYSFYLTTLAFIGIFCSLYFVIQ